MPPTGACLIGCTTYDTQSSALFRLNRSIPQHPFKDGSSCSPQCFRCYGGCLKKLTDAPRSGGALSRLARATTDATVSQILLELAAGFEKQEHALVPSVSRGLIGPQAV